jgi:hypothetical protein
LRAQRDVSRQIWARDVWHIRIGGYSCDPEKSGFIAFGDIPLHRHIEVTDGERLAVVSGNVAMKYKSA